MRRWFIIFIVVLGAGCTSDIAPLPSPNEPGGGAHEDPTLGPEDLDSDADVSEPDTEPDTEDDTASPVEA